MPCKWSAVSSCSNDELSYDSQIKYGNSRWKDPCSSKDSVRAWRWELFDWRLQKSSVSTSSVFRIKNQHIIRLIVRQGPWTWYAGGMLQSWSVLCRSLKENTPWQCFCTNACCKRENEEFSLPWGLTLINLIRFIFFICSSNIKHCPATRREAATEPLVYI